MSWAYRFLKPNTRRGDEYPPLQYEDVDGFFNKVEAEAALLLRLKKTYGDEYVQSDNGYLTKQPYRPPLLLGYVYEGIDPNTLLKTLASLQERVKKLEGRTK